MPQSWENIFHDLFYWLNFRWFCSKNFKQLIFTLQHWLKSDQCCRSWFWEWFPKSLVTKWELPITINKKINQMIRAFETSLNCCLLLSLGFDIAPIRASRLSIDSIFAIRRISFWFLLIITRLIFLTRWFFISVFSDFPWPWNLKNPDRLKASAKEAKMIIISFKFIFSYEGFQNVSKTRYVKKSAHNSVRDFRFSPWPSFFWVEINPARDQAKMCNIEVLS